MSTPPIPLIELAERVRALTCACRVTDALISIAVRYQPYGPDHWVRVPEYPYRTIGRGKVQALDGDGNPLPGAEWPAPEFTASLDAAMTLARTPQDAYQAAQDAISEIAKRDGLHCNLYRGSFVDDLARQVSATLIRARAASENSHGR